jgi:hypothetical protein
MLLPLGTLHDRAVDVGQIPVGAVARASVRRGIAELAIPVKASCNDTRSRCERITGFASLALNQIIRVATDSRIARRTVTLTIQVY